MTDRRDVSENIPTMPDWQFKFSFAESLYECVKVIFLLNDKPIDDPLECSETVEAMMMTASSNHSDISYTKDQCATLLTFSCTLYNLWKEDTQSKHSPYHNQSWQEYITPHIFRICKAHIQ